MLRVPEISVSFLIVFFKCIDIAEKVLKFLKSIRHLMESNKPDFNISAALKAPDNDNFIEMLDGMKGGSSEIWAETPAIEDPAILGFYPPLKSEEDFPPEKKKTLLHEALRREGISPNVQWDDALIRKTSSIHHSALEIYIQAFADGIAVSRQTSLDSTIKTGINQINQAVAKLSGMKLNFSKEVGEIVTKAESSIMAKLNSAAMAPSPPPSVNIHKEMMMKLGFPALAVENEAILRGVQKGITPDTGLKIVSGEIDSVLKKKVIERIKVIIKDSVMASSPSSSKAK